MTDWVEWHRGYDDAASSLSQRLAIVRSRLTEALDGVRQQAVILSLCAGDGRDLITVAKDRPSGVRRVVLVELDPTLAAAGREAAESAALSSIEVRCLDAGVVESFIDVLPVDVLLLCGVFGNVEHQTVRLIIETLPALVREGGYVIWTRGRSEPDRRPELRLWFEEAGHEEVSFDGHPEPYGVGLNRLARRGHPQPTLPLRMFSFLEQAQP